jgi:hypothetical protein
MNVEARIIKTAEIMNTVIGLVISKIKVEETVATKTAVKTVVSKKISRDERSCLLDESAM